MPCKSRVYQACLVLLALVVGGCASQIMQGYVGKNVKEAMLDYGPPTNIIEMGPNERAYQWSMTDSVISPGATFNNGQVVALGQTASYSGTSYATPTIIDENVCHYSLMAKQVGDEWIVTGYRKPQISCE